MSLSACDGMLFPTLQSLFSASVGVAFAFPILSQIIEIKNEKILKESKRIQKILLQKKRQWDFEELGNEKLNFIFHIERGRKYTEKYTVFSILVGVLGFALLVFSTLFQSLCLKVEVAYMFSLFLTMPFFLGVFQVWKWFDGFAKFREVISFFRGDHLIGRDRT